MCPKLRAETCANSTGSDADPCEGCVLNGKCITQWQDTTRMSPASCDDAVKRVKGVGGWCSTGGSTDAGALQLAMFGLAAIAALAVLAVVLAFMINVVFDAYNKSEPEPTFWETVKCTFADLANTNCDKFEVQYNYVGRRDESATMIVNTDSAEAYRVLQVLSTTSGSTVTSMVVSQLQAANYIGAMPTMITTVLTSVTDGSSSSDSNNSNTTLVAVAIVVAAALVLLAVLVVSGLVYVYKVKTQGEAPAAREAVAPPMMGTVELATNPMHGVVDSKDGAEGV